VGFGRVVGRAVAVFEGEDVGETEEFGEFVGSLEDLDVLGAGDPVFLLEHGLGNFCEIVLVDLAHTRNIQRLINRFLIEYPSTI
jgi:hypothetical protein